MHIVYVSREYPPSLRGGGIASYLKEVAEYIASVGHKVTVVCASDDTRMAFDEIVNGVRVIRLKGGDFVIPQVEHAFYLRRLRQRYRYYSYRRRVAECVNALGHIDVIEVAEYGGESLFIDKSIAPIAIRLHTPALFDRRTGGIVPRTLKNFWIYDYAQYEIELIKKSKYITSCSESLKQWTIKNLGVDSKKIEIIRNPVNYQKLSRGKEETNLNKDELNVVFVGTICESKGCKELVEACKVLKKKYQKLVLWMFGKRGIWADALEAENHENGWINFYGKIDRDYLYSIYKNADLVCLPSWWDNLPMTCIEGMMAGGIVLGSNAGGMAEMLEDGKTGFLVAPKDVKSLVEKIDAVLSMPEEEKMEIRAAAKKEAVKNYATEEIVGQLLEYYKKIARS